MDSKFSFGQLPNDIKVEILDIFFRELVLPNGVSTREICKFLDYLVELYGLS